MLEVSKIWVSSLDLDYFNLYWEIADTVEDHLLYSFYIERSESMAGPWTTIGGPFKDKWSFRDTQVNRRHRLRSYNYRLRIVEDATSNTAYSDVVLQKAETDLITVEIRRRMTVLFKEFVGRKAWLFPVRTFGTRCADCWDETRQKVMKDRCQTCFGTGFAGGYMSPIEMLIQLDPESGADQATPSGEILDTTTTARMLALPPVKSKDLIIEAENIRWLVMNVSQTRKLRAVSHQQLQLHQVFPGDIAFKVPVKVDEKNLDPSPGREFTNPQQVEELKTTNPGIEDVLRVYGFPFSR